MARAWTGGGIAASVAVALALAGTPSRTEAAPPAEPPTGTGLIVSGGVVVGIGGAALLGGVVMLIVGAGAREGYLSAIGAWTGLAGGVVAAIGVGLLAPGLVRRGKHRDWEAQNMALSPGAGSPTNVLPAAFGQVPIGRRLTLSPSASGLVLRF